jgi:hypothetical protein
MSNICYIYARYGEALLLDLNDLESARQQFIEAIEPLYPNFISSHANNYSYLIADSSVW